MDTQERLVADRYALLSPLGEGGMGTVWRARDELLGREVAVKEITFPPGLSDAERDVLRERTRREARAAASLQHPSAVTVYDVVEEDGSPYLVMELVEARTLSQVVRTDGPLSPQRTAQVGLALLGALEAAHQRGIVHRDVKPSNVLVRDDGRVVLTDFGIATSTSDPSITHTGLLLGSPAYLSPERARGLQTGPPSDLWSLGATLYTAVEGRPPFAGDEPLLVVSAVVTGEPAPCTAAGPLGPVLLGLLDKDPERRLDAAGARPALQRIADTEVAPPTRVLAAPVEAEPLAAAGTSALDVAQVRREVAAVPLRPIVRPARREPALLAPPSRPARRRWIIPTAAAAVLLAAAGTGLALNAGREPDGSVAEPARTSAAPSAAASAPAPPAPSASAPAAAPTPQQPSAAPSLPPSPAPSAPPSPAPSAPPVAAAPAGGSGTVPAGWSTDTGAAGWTVALPPGYRQTRGGEYVQSSTGRTLRVETGTGQPDAVADRERAEASFRRHHPTYERIAITGVDYRGYEAADWEFTYEGLHVLNRVFVVEGTGHSLFFQTRARDFAGAREDVQGIVSAFRPA